MSAARLIGLALGLGLLAACDGNPFDVPPTTDTPPGEVPEELARDMTAMSYDKGVLKIDMQGVSSSGKMAEFVRTPSLDVASGTDNPKYKAYVYQETGLTRYYVAYVAENARGNLVATSAADGGQFNEHNAGGRWMRVSEFTRPDLGQGPEEGLFSYAGSYAGIFVPGEYATAANGVPSDLDPAAPFYVEGTILINGDFAHNAVEGGVTDRRLFDLDGNQITGLVINDGDPTTTDETIDTTTLAALSLRETEIDETGSFLGNVEFYGAPGQDVGDYGGAFGGIEASDVAGVLWLNPIEGQNGIWEYGTFNLPRCDLAGASPLCVPR